MLQLRAENSDKFKTRAEVQPQDLLVIPGPLMRRDAAYLWSGEAAGRI